MKIGDLVWCRNDIRKNMGIIVRSGIEHTLYGKPLGPENYVWIVLMEGSPGQQKWAQVKNLELISEGA